jgi:hypothetical protein
LPINPSALKKLLIFFLLIHVFELASQSSFPENWMGDYSGKMTLGYLDRPGDELTVELSIQEVIPDSVWTHKMIYRSERFGDITKDYLIRAQKKGEKQRFVLDEQNGIGMDLSLMGNCFYGFYSVMGTTYINTLRLNDDGTLLFDLFAGDESTKKTDKLDDDGEPFEVNSYTIALHQTVLLSKKK